MITLTASMTVRRVFKVNLDPGLEGVDIGVINELSERIGDGATSKTIPMFSQVVSVEDWHDDGESASVISFKLDEN